MRTLPNVPAYACLPISHFPLLHDFSDMIPAHGEWFFGDQKLCQNVAVVQKKVKIESSNGFLWHVSLPTKCA